MPCLKFEAFDKLVFCLFVFLDLFDFCLFVFVMMNTISVRNGSVIFVIFFVCLHDLFVVNVQ